MKNYLRVLGILIIWTISVYGNEKSLKSNYSSDLTVNKAVKSIGYYLLDDEFCDRLFAFDYKDKVLIVDSDSEFFSYGEYSYSYSNDYFVIGVSGSPTGGHNRNIFLFKEEKNKLKLIGHIAPEIRDIWEMYPEKYVNIWQLKDIDNDGKLEYLIYTFEVGYVFFEITENGFVIDLNPLNYENLENKITNKRDKGLNKKFILKEIKKNTVEKVFSLNNTKEFSLEQKGEN